MRKDPTGYYTDTGNFIELIPECTNISIGVWDEHHKSEYVDIKYVEEVAEASTKIDWDNLPSDREPKWWLDEPQFSGNKEFIKQYSKFSNRKEDARIFGKISSVLDDENYLLMNKSGFEPGKEMVFSHWFEEKNVKIKVLNGQIELNGKSLRFKKNIKSAILREIKKES